MKYSELNELIESYSECKNEDSEVRTYLKRVGEDDPDLSSDSSPEQDSPENEDSFDEEDDFILTIDFNDIWVQDFCQKLTLTHRLPHLKQLHIDHCFSNFPSPSSSLSSSATPSSLPSDYPIPKFSSSSHVGLINPDMKSL